MARNIKAGEHVTVDKLVNFDTTSESYENGLTQVEPGQVGIVIGAASQGRASIVEFNGIRATLSNRSLIRTQEKPPRSKRGRKKKALPTSKAGASSKLKSMDITQTTLPDETSVRLVTVIANTLLLNGGIKDEGDAVIHMQFADLPESVKTQIRTLIEAKLALN